MIERYLLDTCAIIWRMEGQPLSRAAIEMISRKTRDAAFVSAMSGWEIGMLVAKGRLPVRKTAMSWFEDAVEMMGAEMIDVSLPTLIASSFLPQPIHNDPTDRILIATARENDLTIITRDRAILAYGAAGHVKVLAC